MYVDEGVGGAGVGFFGGDGDVVQCDAVDVAEVHGVGGEGAAEHGHFGVGGFFFWELEGGVLIFSVAGELDMDVVEGEVLDGVVGDAVDDDSDSSGVGDVNIADGNVAEGAGGLGAVARAEGF